MAYRSRMSGKASRSNFTRNANRIHRKNMAGNPMRGGIRL